MVFIRRKRNRSGSISIQIVHKTGALNKVIKTVGCAVGKTAIEVLEQEAEKQLRDFTKQRELEFPFPEDQLFLEQVHLGLREVRVIGPELILGKLFDEVGYNQIPDFLFRQLVITRLVYPGSKLKTVDYLLRYKGIHTNADRIYRFMDKFNLYYKQTAIDLTFEHTKRLNDYPLTVAFYDVTTLYFEASDEDDLRRIGYSKDGRNQNPQVLFALLVGLGGQLMAFEIFSGDTYEGHTLIPVMEKFKEKYKISSLIMVAGLLSSKNIEKLIQLNYPFILGARIKNKSAKMKERILSHDYTKMKTITIQKFKDMRLIVNYAQKRAKKDEYSRQKGLKRLEHNLKSGKLTKEKINNRGYNKYLRIKNEIEAEIDYEDFKADAKWNGLKGYMTSSDLSAQEVMDHYKQLWAIEKAFRISKTDLRFRPVFHRLEKRIKTHICIAFCSYKIQKEFERQLKMKKIDLSVTNVLNALKTIYQVNVILPKSKKCTSVLLPLDDVQKTILNAFNVNY